MFTFSNNDIAQSEARSAYWELELRGRVEAPPTPTTPTALTISDVPVEEEPIIYPTSANHRSTSAPADFARPSKRIHRSSVFPSSTFDEAARVRATEERHRRIATTHPPEVLTSRKPKWHSSLSGSAGRYNRSEDEGVDVDQGVVGNEELILDSEQAKGEEEKVKVEAN